MAKPKKIYRPDEEPEREDQGLIDRSVWWYKGCNFCGHEDHQEKDCPSKPR